jgi:ribosomal subunit interface protein
MQFVGHSTSNIFGNRLKRYAEEKLQRPILRHQLDGTDVSVRAEAEENGNSIDFKVSVFIPGKEAIVVTATEDQLNAAIDIAADKLERSLRSLKNRSNPREEVNQQLEDYTEDFGENDYLTDGEEEVLRQLDALDDILDV